MRIFKIYNSEFVYCLGQEISADRTVGQISDITSINKYPSFKIFDNLGYFYKLIYAGNVIVEYDYSDIDR